MMKEIRLFNGAPADLGGRSEAETAVYALLDSLGTAYATACHEAAFTMEQCAAVEQALGAPICKNLFLCNRQPQNTFDLPIFYSFFRVLRYYNRNCLQKTHRNNYFD